MIDATKSNVMTFADVLNEAKAFGELEAKGKDGQIKFLLKVAEAAFLGAIDISEHKHGPGIDDATKLTEAYVKARGGANIFDHRAPNQRKACSMTRTMIKLGQWPKGGPGEPLSTLNDLITMRQKMRKDPAYAKKLKDAADTAVSYARAQIKPGRDSVIPANMLQEFCFKPAKVTHTEADYWESLRKKTTNARVGKGDVLVDEATAKSIEALCTKRLKAIVGGDKATASETEDETSTGSTPAQIAL